MLGRLPSAHVLTHFLTDAGIDHLDLTKSTLLREHEFAEVLCSDFVRAFHVCLRAARPVESLRGLCPPCRPGERLGPCGGCPRGKRGRRGAGGPRTRSDGRLTQTMTSARTGFFWSILSGSGRCASDHCPRDGATSSIMQQNARLARHTYTAVAPLHLFHMDERFLFAPPFEPRHPLPPVHTYSRSRCGKCRFPSDGSVLTAPTVCTCFARQPSPSSRLAELSQWLEQSGAASAQLVPAEMRRLAPDSIARIEELFADAAADAAAGRRRATWAPTPLALPAWYLLAPTDVNVQVGGVPAAHEPGEAVLYTRGSGPVPFGERGVVIAVQGARCEVIFEREGFCSTGHFARLKTHRAAVVPASALLNLSRPPRGAFSQDGAVPSAGCSTHMPDPVRDLVNGLPKHGASWSTNPFTVLMQLGDS
eukprot:129461-Pleurochrysis_carterae.AAC.3